jgi:hypothetical protein
MSRLVVAGSFAALALLVVPGAVAKDFKPGDLRICNRAPCVPIADRRAVATLGSFYVVATELRRLARPLQPLRVTPAAVAKSH